MEQVSLLRVSSYQNDLPVKIKELLEPLGGLSAYCQYGDRILLKPNFLTARTIESGATTHPAIIMAMVTLLKDIGCTVAIGDSPGWGSAVGVANKLGLTESLKHFGVKVIELETLAPLDLKRSATFERRFKNLQLAGELEAYNKIINLPKLKTHGQMGLTLATKNLFGCVAGHDKVQWHFSIGRDYKEFARLLVEIALTVNATLHILDGIIGMDGNGPTYGRPKQFNLLIAGTNPLAVDRLVVELIRKKPEQFPIFAAAHNLQVPGLVMNEIEVKGEAIHSCLIRDFEIPGFQEFNILNKGLTGLIARLFKQRLLVDPKRCTQCRKCETQCPAKAIAFSEKMNINDELCIKCCCCQEMCPVGALSIRTPFLTKVLRGLKLM